MPLVIQCPSCAKRYQVADAVAGKQVRCQQCQTAFVATLPKPAPASPAPLAPPDPFAAEDPLGGVDLSRLPTVAPPAQSHPLGSPAAAPTSSFFSPALKGGVSNPSGGPTDTVMRLVSGGMLAAGILMVVATIAMNAATGTV